MEIRKVTREPFSAFGEPVLIEEEEEVVGGLHPRCRGGVDMSEAVSFPEGQRKHLPSSFLLPSPLAAREPAGTIHFSPDPHIHHPLTSTSI